MTAEADSGPGQRSARVFFAIWPDAAARRQLGRLAKQLESVCGGRRTRAGALHLTLVFLGEIAGDRLDALRLAAEGVKAQPFDFAIEEIHYWKHNRIAYAAATEAPRELLDLVRALEDVLSATGFAFDRQQAYRPHITLVRKALCHDLPGLSEPITWRAREWVLVKSEQTDRGSVYAEIGRWLLERQVHSGQSGVSG